MNRHRLCTDLLRPYIMSDLSTRCLSLTGAFETSRKPPQCFAAIAGNFDGQGMSFGALQWNLGQGTLQPMLQEMDSNHSDIIDAYFGINASSLREMLQKPRGEQVAWAISIQDSGHHLVQPWHDQFAALGLTEEYQAIEVERAQQRFNAASGWCGDYDIHSERAVALMFDINVQNGSISAQTKAQILQDFQDLQPTGDANQDEINRMVIIANRRADASHPPYQEDVRSRKLCIANGLGTVHGISYDVEADFGITMAPAL
jgi:hypothetical protein